MLHCSWYAMCNRCNFYFLIWVIFSSFTSLTTKKIKTLKRWKTHLEMSLFYTCAPKLKITWCTVSETCRATDGETDGQIDSLKMILMLLELVLWVQSWSSHSKRSIKNSIIGWTFPATLIINDHLLLTLTNAIFTFFYIWKQIMFKDLLVNAFVKYFSTNLAILDEHVLMIKKVILHIHPRDS